MIKSLPARAPALILLSIVAALMFGTLALKGATPAEAGGGPDSVKYGTVDQLTQEEIELLDSDTPKTVVVDFETGDITSVTPDDTH